MQRKQSVMNNQNNCTLASHADRKDQRIHSFHLPFLQIYVFHSNLDGWPSDYLCFYHIKHKWVTIKYSFFLHSGLTFYNRFSPCIIFFPFICSLPRGTAWDQSGDEASEVLTPVKAKPGQFPAEREHMHMRRVFWTVLSECALRSRRRGCRTDNRNKKDGSLIHSSSATGELLLIQFFFF